MANSAGSLGGRKSLKEELQVIQYMAELEGPTFKFLKECLASKNRADKKWAVEQMMKLYGKAIPEPGENPNQPIYVSIAKEIAEKNSIETSTQETNAVDPSPEPNSQEPSEVSGS